MAKSSFSNSQGNCVDVAKVRMHGRVYIRVRDTKDSNPEAYLLFTPDEWHAFCEGFMKFEFLYENLEVVEDPYTITERINT